QRRRACRARSAAFGNISEVEFHGVATSGRCHIATQRVVAPEERSRGNPGDVEARARAEGDASCIQPAYGPSSFGRIRANSTTENREGKGLVAPGPVGSARVVGVGAVKFLGEPR